ncbi:BBP7 family outer membrane beta-barrel protein [Anatilimnocola sp. NA78]|uniref:BBP7 family outer membrane beta-barrel protein n=1 Tax=Anatilimnocola sp. NA78 TaxID=3415683 RepID=UPI003CE519CF
MRAIAGLFGLALLGVCTQGFGQRPLTIQELEPAPIERAEEAGRPNPAEEPLPMAQPEFAPPAPMPYTPPQAMNVPHPDEISMLNNPHFADEESGLWPAQDYACGARCHAWWHTAWYIRIEALFLQRSQGFTGQTLVESDVGAPLLSSDAFSYNFEPGVSALIGHRVSCVAAWELSYFGAQEWSGTESVSSLNNLDLPDPIGAFADDFNNANSIAVTYRSHLHNAEVNYLRDHAGIAWLIGFRYLNWDENLNFLATDNDADVSNYEIGASNNLIGAQIGARTVYHARWWQWELTGKAGVFGNNVNQKQTLGDDDNAIVVRNVSVQETGGSFVGDFNISGHCQLNDIWRVRAGYNLLFVTGLALAPDQIDFTNAPLSGTVVDRSGTVFLHGLNVGLEAVW